ncbi:TPA: hypothetical protein N0F65_000276, partial [Lagenidium giganteum]
FDANHDIDLHLRRMENQCLELKSYKHELADETMVEMMFNSLPSTPEFEALKSSVYYGTNATIGTQDLRELIKSAFTRFQSRKRETHGRKGGMGSATKQGVYIKNRVYHKAAQVTPYARMFEVKPDIHNIRKFGSIAYVCAKRSRAITSARQRKNGISAEHTRKWAPDMQIDESIVNKDRHMVGDNVHSEWLHFASNDESSMVQDAESIISEEMKSAIDMEDGSSVCIVTGIRSDIDTRVE